MDIICLGELLIDMFPAEMGKRLADVSAFHPKPGGAPANVAVACARLGRESAFIGKVGDDAFGHYLADVLRRNQVNVSGLRFDAEARTTMAFIAKPDENTSEFVFYRNPGADMRLRSDELDRNLLSAARALHFGSISLIAEPSRSATLAAIDVVRQTGALISYDVNYRPDLWPDPETAIETIKTAIPPANVLKVNEDELELLTGVQDLAEAAQSLLGFGPDLCVVTLGREGSYFQLAAGGKRVDAFRVKTVDATGCGDAFVAGLLTQLTGGDDWRSHLTEKRMTGALTFAAAVSALTAQSWGTIPALPTADEAARFLDVRD